MRFLIILRNVPILLFFATMTVFYKWHLKHATLDFAILGVLMLLVSVIVHFYFAHKINKNEYQKFEIAANQSNAAKPISNPSV